MKRLLLDINIYGLLVADPELFVLKYAYEQKIREFPIYGFNLIRKELRDTPKSKNILGRNLRVAMLSLYDEFVSKHNLIVSEAELTKIALEYYETYQKIGGNIEQKELMKDYMIVACAALKKMDIVVSHDHATMLSELSLKAYTLVNDILHLHNPKFMDYNEFRNILMR